MTLKEFDLYEKIETTGPFASSNFYYEIPTGNWLVSRKRIDLVTIKRNNLITIEVKINDWKTVLKQAFSNLFVADYSYVAIWHTTLPKINCELFNDLGIGILEVNGSCKMVLKAKPSHLIIPEKRRYVKKQCKMMELKTCQNF